MAKILPFKKTMAALVKDSTGRLHCRIARWDPLVQAYWIHWRDGRKYLRPVQE